MSFKQKRVVLGDIADISSGGTPFKVKSSILERKYSMGEDNANSELHHKRTRCG